jgi:hypothetical protein
MGDIKQHNEAIIEAADSDATPSVQVPATSEGLTTFRRGEQVDDATASKAVDGFDAAQMRDRSLLTAEEEKALMRRVDWRIMTICSLLFLMKNLDSDNISNARIMNRGTDTNIMTALGMTADQYNLLTVFYYVSSRNSLWLQ